MVRMSRGKNKGQVFIFFCQDVGKFYTVYIRHINIQKYCLGLVYRSLLQRFLAAGGNISYHPGYFFNYRLKKKACSGLIINYKDSHILPFRKIQNPIYKVDKTIASR